MWSIKTFHAVSGLNQAINAELRLLVNLEKSIAENVAYSSD